MATNYSPLPGTTIVIDGFSSIKKAYLPAAPRAFPAGAAMWDNGANGIEPCLLSPTAHGSLATTASGTTYASTYTTAALFQAAFAPYFCGIAAQPRIPQQLYSFSQFSNGGAFTSYVDDASTPFISLYTEGIALAPLMTAIASQQEVGTLVGPATFVNEGATGLYDPAGCLQKDTKYYAYMGAWEILGTQTAANASGRLVERARVGDMFIKFEFHSFLQNFATIG
jgi:hypothetical protein